MCSPLEDVLSIGELVYSLQLLNQPLRWSILQFCDACKEAVWLKGLYAELPGDTSCIDLFCESQSAIYLTKDKMFHERTKHNNIKYHYAREVITEGRLKVPKISTHDNPADLMMKPILDAKFELCSSLVGKQFSPSSYFGTSSCSFYLFQDDVYMLHATR
jgi:hypothetical protein